MWFPIALGKKGRGAVSSDAPLPIVNRHKWFDDATLWLSRVLILRQSKRRTTNVHGHAQQKENIRLRVRLHKAWTLPSALRAFTFKRGTMVLLSKIFLGLFSPFCRQFGNFKWYTLGRQPLPVSKLINSFANKAGDYSTSLSGCVALMHNASERNNLRGF